MPRLSRRPAFAVDALVREVVDKSACALSAYEIARELTTGGRSVAATQAYRALTRLVEDRCVGRIEGLNAYCSRADGAGPVIFCRECRTFVIADRDDLAAAANESAKRLSFTVRTVVAEISGVCASCSTGQTP